MRRCITLFLAVAGTASAAAVGGCGSRGPAEGAAAARQAVAALPEATGPWSEVVARDLPVAAPTQAAGLSFGRDGRSLLTWGPPQEEGVPSPQARLATFAPDGRPVLTGTIPRSLASAPFFGAQGRVQAASYVYDDTTGQKALGLSTVPREGGTAKSEMVDQGYSELNAFDVAVGAGGETTAAWIESTRYDESSEYVRARVRVAFAPAGSSRFGKPTTLLDSARAYEPSDNDVSVAAGPDGRAIVVVDATDISGDRRDGLLVWTRRGGPPGGPGGVDRLGAPMRVAPGPVRHLEAAMTSDGRSVVAWSEQGGGEEASTGYVVKAWSLALGAPQSNPVETLDRGSLKAFSIGGFALGTGPEGTATLAWTGVGRKSYPALISTAGSDGRFGDPQQLTRNGRIGRLAIRDDGAAVVTVGPSDAHPADEVDRDPGDEERSVAFTRPTASAPFGAAEPLPLPKAREGQGALLPAPALDPVTGRPSVAYVLAGENGAPARIVTVTRRP